ncbi:MAG: hypothetical protein ACE37B_16880 [Ilumatobacter sp.]|uniref:hypothetical protein n=1 Tax=Ilumatobacter sp. TaxID=1967498 RepID=UPI003918F085
MATADQFRQAANDARSAIADAEDAERICRLYRHDTGLIGGRVRESVEWAFDSSVFNARSLADDCAALAIELDARATVCDQYNLAYDNYLNARSNWAARYERFADGDDGASHPGPMPTPPSKPEPWVTRG